MERVAIHRSDLVSLAKARLLGRRTGLDLLDADRTKVDLRKDAGIVEVEILPLGRLRDVQRSLNLLSAAIDGDGYVLIEVQRGAIPHLHPVRAVYTIKAADDVAGFETRAVSSRIGDDPFDRRLADDVLGNFVDPVVIENHQHEGQDEIGHRPGKADQHALPSRMRGKAAGVVGRLAFGRVLSVILT